MRGDSTKNKLINALREEIRFLEETEATEEELSTYRFILSKNHEFRQW